MRKEGTIVRWDDAKGFGFIRSGAVAQDVFVHVRDYRSSAGETPRPGLRVTFEDVHVGGKGPRAVAVTPMVGSAAGKIRGENARAVSSSRKQVSGKASQTSHSGAWWALPLMVAYTSGLIGLVWQQQVPWWVLPGSFILNLSTFVAYWQDKHAAQTGRWRTKEETLHLWSLAGGWCGAWIAQRVLRHKSMKASFLGAYRFTVFTHCAVVLGICWLLRAA